jgi:hypothetical protein
MSKAVSPAADAAREALEQVKVALTNTELKVLDAKGADITGKHFGTTKPMGSPACDDNGMRDFEDSQEDLLGVTRRATELSMSTKLQPSGAENNGKVHSAVLVTDNRRTLLRAAGEKIATFTPSALKKYLETGVGRMRSLSRGSQGRSPELKTTSPTIGGSKDPNEAIPSDNMDTGQ